MLGSFVEGRKSNIQMQSRPMADTPYHFFQLGLWTLRCESCPPWSQLKKTFQIMGRLPIHEHLARPSESYCFHQVTSKL